MVATVAPKPKISIGFLVWRGSHDRKVDKVPISNPAPAWTSLAPFRSAAGIVFEPQSVLFCQYRHQVFRRLLGLFSHRADFVVLITSRVLNSPGHPAPEWTLSSIKPSLILWTPWVVHPQSGPDRSFDVMNLGFTRSCSSKVNSAGYIVRLLALIDPFSVLALFLSDFSEH